MSTMTLEEIQQDSVVLSVARALQLANREAIAHGTDPASSMITISAEATQPPTWWRIHYLERRRSGQVARGREGTLLSHA